MENDHECMELNTCQCSTWYLEPNEDCPIHGGGPPWPPRCMYCGKFMCYEKIETDYDILIGLLYNLDYYTQTVHLDMGGKHKYSIWGKGHEILTEIKAFLHELDKEKGD